MIDLTGKRVFITGASRGIGAACARLFARAGAVVALHFHQNRAAAEGVLAQLPSGDHLLLAADMAAPKDIQQAFRELRESWGGLDILINNAGIWVHNPLASFDAGKLSETWAVNVTAPFLCACEALPLFVGAEDANIVNLTSTAGQRGEAFYSPYAASKGAMISATKAWSSELGPRVRVNSVAPGWVDTDMSAAALRGDTAQRQAIEQAIPLHRVATAEDIAGPVLFLASPLARHITGEILNVNGGSVLVG